MMRVHTATAVVAALFLASSMFGHNVALRLLLLGSGLILAAIVAFQPREGVSLLPPVWLPFLLWGAWALLSLTWSLEPERTLKEWRNEVFYTGAGLWICYVGAQAREARRIFIPVMGTAAVVACVVALREFSQGPFQYNAGWHGGSGDHSSALLTLMPCVAMAAWHASRSGRAWLVAACAMLACLLFASAYTTLNRTIWLGFALQFVLLGALLLRRMRHAGAKETGRARRVAALAAVAIVLGAAAITLKIHAQREVIGSVLALERDGRLALWPEIVARISERPLTGFGFGRGLLRESLQQEFGARDPNLWHAHNLFLETLVQTGIPALALLLLLLGAVLRQGWRLTLALDVNAAACGMALIAVVAGMLVRNMTDSLLVRQNALLFWGVVAVLMAIGSKRWQASS